MGEMRRLGFQIDAEEMPEAVERKELFFARVKLVVMDWPKFLSVYAP
jgi:hypothetical protein